MINLKEIASANKVRIFFVFGVIFFSWGVNTVLNSELKVYLDHRFNIGSTGSSLEDLPFHLTYLIMAIVGGFLIGRLGYKSALLIGWVMATLACFVVYLAVDTGNHYLYLFGLAISASGITIMQVAANLYIVLFGSHRTAAARLNFTQAFNAIGPFVATLIGVFMHEIVVSFTEKDGVTAEVWESHHIKYPFLIVGIVMFVFTWYFYKTRLPVMQTAHLEPENKITSLRKRHVMHFSQLRLGAFAIFAYVGAEVAMGNYLKNYAPELTIYYWGLAMVGRFIGSALLLKFSARKAVAFSSGMACLLVIFSVLFPVKSAVYMVMSIGLFNSILFPTIFSLGVNGLGRFSLNGSVILIMFISGGALIPFNVANFAVVNYKVAFLIPMICYFYIAYYGAKLSHFERNPEV